MIDPRTPPEDLDEDTGADEGVSRQIRQTGGPPKRPESRRRFDPNLTDMVIDEVTSTGITDVLGRLVRDTRASSGMVIDRAGQIIAFNGQEYRGEMMMLGALIAGTYASTREMAKILHEEHFRMLLQEGSKEKIFTEAVGDHWLVSVIFDRHTHLGLVKVLSNRATLDLSQILDRAIESNRNRPREMDAGLARITRDTIDLLFRKEDA
ncbi:MAG: hypothetical protein AVDCRST_MAG70-2049 [uncultured Thermomicrobiales bacterium]|uniref:Roadblock/LAMTOR2 domain-containing protein n=1 Tax=uncultured Thermomicrobiales bacterium TaxID=1645740 RepID=A0A6J4V6V7_9BACT|nr:MAG: hypothetical protein AVDCRST_MAG70-2049 [uncultured Thermomicrobiales bacterium]